MKYAVLFPGQGSQSVGMLQALVAREPLARQALQEAGEHLGWDVAGLVGGGPAEELNRTERTQPCLLAAGIATWRVWQDRATIAPQAMAGHSLGEYTALVAAGSLDFGTALKLVEVRGALMQQAVPAGTGGMAAVIGMDDVAVDALCKSCDAGILEAVNFNAPGQVVVAGETAALAWLDENAKSAGARMVMRLPVSVPSHCALMRGAAEKLYTELANSTFSPPGILVLHNLDAQPRSDAASVRLALRDQLYRPVRWTQTVQALVGQGCEVFLECGPGKVLSGLNKRIGKLPSIALEEPAEMDRALLEVCGVTQ